MGAFRPACRQRTRVERDLDRDQLRMQAWPGGVSRVPTLCGPQDQLMPAPRWLARFNRHATNRLLGRLATHLPAFGVVVHQGRATGRVYRTPVNVFRRPGGYVVALTYGSRSEWVRNVMASGGCRLETRGRSVALSHPRLVHDSRRRAVPPPVRFVLGLLRVDDFLDLSLDERPGGRPA